mgnify:CR=1 FL=1
MRTPTFVFAATVLFAACGSDDNSGKKCDPAKNDCGAGTICEAVQGGDFTCFAPILLRGKVVDAQTGNGIAGARIQAADINGSAVGTSAVSGSDGSYSLELPATRDKDGKPVAGDYTLRAQAAGYQSFPSPIRPALPIDATTAVAEGEAIRWVIENAQTDISLIPLEQTAGLGSISGKILSDQKGGVLVVAEGGGGSSTFSDSAGEYTIFNVPAGNYTVRGYAKGVQLTPAQIVLAAGEKKTGVDLAASTRPLSTVTGSLQIVNGTGATSVILAVESTFQENAARGEMPPGLRAPPPGTAPNVTGAFTIDGVPDGRYVVLAAFENDGLVRDPDQTIGGTKIVHIEVPGTSGTTVNLPESFKVTAALNVVSPGAAGPEGVPAGPLAFRFADDSSEDKYEVRVFDAFGREVWSDLNVPRVTGSPTVSVSYGGPALEEGMYYQFRATSIKDGVPISATEDLKGVFFVNPAP